MVETRAQKNKFKPWLTKYFIKFFMLKKDRGKHETLFYLIKGLEYLRIFFKKS